MGASSPIIKFTATGVTYMSQNFNLTGVQFVAKQCGASISGGENGGHCWLCGGDVVNGHKLRDIVPETLTNHNQASSPSSGYVCAECAAMTSKESWEEYVDNNQEMGLKKGYAVSWRCYSHAAWDGHHECPKRDRWRELLESPPDPPFVFCIAISSQKQILFRSKISFSTDVFYVQFEDETLLISRRAFLSVIYVFEELYSGGFSKDSIKTGSYNSKRVMKFGIKKWRSLDDKIATFRSSNINEIKLAHFCAQKDEK